MPMKNKLSKFAKKVAEKVYKFFEYDSGKMLLMTSIIATSTSALAQAGAIVVNKKYTNAQKRFMVPHELIDGGLMVASIFIVTRPVQCISRKFIKSGKILTSDMAKYLQKYNMTEKRGCADFSFPDKIKEIMQKIEKSDNFIKSSEKEKEQLLQEHKSMLENFDIFEDSVSAIVTTGATAASISLVSPLLRNYALSKIPQINQAKMKSDNDSFNKKNVSFASRNSYQSPHFEYRTCKMCII